MKGKILQIVFRKDLSNTIMQEMRSEWPKEIMHEKIERKRTLQGEKKSLEKNTLNEIDGINVRFDIIK